MYSFISAWTPWISEFLWWPFKKKCYTHWPSEAYKTVTTHPLKILKNRKMRPLPNPPNLKIILTHQQIFKIVLKSPSTIMWCKLVPSENYLKIGAFYLRSKHFIHEITRQLQNAAAGNFFLINGTFLFPDYAFSLWKHAYFVFPHICNSINTQLPIYPS